MHGHIDFVLLKSHASISPRMNMGTSPDGLKCATENTAALIMAAQANLRRFLTPWNRKPRKKVSSASGATTMAIIANNAMPMPFVLNGK